MIIKTLVILIFFLDVYVVFSKESNDVEREFSQKLKKLAFERFKLNKNDNNKLIYNMIYMPPDLDTRTLNKYNIKTWWSKRKLTWWLKNHPSTLTMSQTLYAFERAFYLWSEQTALLFNPICLANFFIENCINIGNSRKADIEIEFIPYMEHDAKCEHKFAQSTLAHAFYPEKGVVHFNMDKNWSTNDTQFVALIKSDLYNNHYFLPRDYQYNLITVAAHEIGHLLGFGHSTKSASIMHEKYKSHLGEFKFSQEDTEAVQYLYGKPSDRDEMFKYSRRNRKKFNLV